ncbi:MAG: type II toxin-antitoxin system RelE/ParE family toxin [Sulfurimonas sp.]|uniref:type II toxin-antitoxin system RelE/ParE family toxin n=1 Tax=Sulfurimonas sp. TaxID=2022749 RepID=UPI002636615B|nr:type II toxin-antitoxin system RelE/ParE family toxin [Sulfurimonas sp.]MDD2652164.1 type II toxin-antitoxin system RelE/ParE family toxin [Sulfurimonas sp.]MDD3450553.1 type II toxin-antitoxin system RelE/ParE family toxin [Sulfurimonas sp.]
MRIIYTELSIQQLQNIREYISLDSKKTAIAHLSNIKNKIEILSTYPYIGKINASVNSENIREYVVLGYKVIYQISNDKLYILAIYKNIDFNEEDLSFLD